MTRVFKLKNLNLNVLFLTAMLPFASRAQVTTFDSLSYYNQLANQVKDSIPSLAFQYGNKAIALAEKQRHPEKVISIYLLLGSRYSSISDYTNALKYYHKVISVSRKLNKSGSELMDACQGIGVSFMRLSQLDSARYYLYKSLALAKKLKEYTTAAGLYSDLGNVSLGENELKNALSLFILSANLFDSLADQEGESKALANIGNVEYILGNYDKALAYASKVITMNQSISNLTYLAYANKLMGRVYRKMKEPDKAINAYINALKVYDQMGSRRDAAEVHQNIGNIYFDKNDIKKAALQYSTSLTIARYLHDSVLMAYDYAALGEANQQDNNPVNAIHYADSTRVLAQKITLPYLVMDAHELLSSVYEQQHNYTKALSNYKLYNALKDSLNNFENRRGTEELEIKYQSEKKQREIELLKKDRQLNEIELKRERTIQYGVIGFLILLGLIGFLLINRYRVLQRAERFVEMEVMRNNIARDLHDDMGSTLSSINIISQLALTENKPDNYAHHFQRIGDQSLKMMENMADIVWSINPHNDSIEKMAMRMKEFAGEILEPKNIGYQFQGEEALQGDMFTVEKRKNVFLIFKEALNNVAKYSQASEVKINLSIHDHLLTLLIADNGKGFNPAQIKEGNGLTNMKTRAEAIGGKLTIDSQVGDGTSIMLQVTIT